jgi:hypothetical protein
MSNYVYCYVECRHSECRYTECHYPDCRGAIKVSPVIIIRILRIPIVFFQIFFRTSNNHSEAVTLTLRVCIS